MSELRARCMQLADSLEPFMVVRYDKDGSGYCRQIDILEAFAKEQQIKGMEAVHTDLVGAALAHTDTSGQAALGAFANTLLDEIAKLKEGG